MVEQYKQVALEYVKDDTSRVTVLHGGGSSRPGYSTIKRGTVMLPKFSRDEKYAFLKYPVWKLQWEEHIKECETDPLCYLITWTRKLHCKLSG